MARLSSSVAKNEFIVRHASLGALSIDTDDATTLIELLREGARVGEGRGWGRGYWNGSGGEGEREGGKGDDRKVILWLVFLFRC